MSLARTRAVDMVLVAAFDRSMAHLVRALEEFQHLGVGFTSLREQLDLGSPTGRVMFAVIAAMAEFERELIRERVSAGLRRGRAQGKRLGRPPRIFRRDRILALHEAGQSLTKIAGDLGVSRRTVQRVLRREQNPLPEFCPPSALGNPPGPATSSSSQ